MKHFLIFIFIPISQLAITQVFDTIHINSKDEHYLKKRRMVLPKAEGGMMYWQLDHYFKKSCPSAYYVVSFRLNNISYKTYEGLVIKGKYQGKWIVKDLSKEIISTYEFNENKFDGEQILYENYYHKQFGWNIICKKNEIVEITKFDEYGKAIYISCYSKGKLISKEYFALSELNIRN